MAGRCRLGGTDWLAPPTLAQNWARLYEKEEVDAAQQGVSDGRGFSFIYVARHVCGFSHRHHRSARDRLRPGAVDAPDEHIDPLLLYVRGRHQDRRRGAHAEALLPGQLESFRFLYRHLCVDRPRHPSRLDKLPEVAAPATLRAAVERVPCAHYGLAGAAQRDPPRRVGGRNTKRLSFATPA